VQRKERGCERIGEQVRETKTVGCAPTERRRHGVISDLNKLRYVPRISSSNDDSNGDSRGARR